MIEVELPVRIESMNSTTTLRGTMRRKREQRETIVYGLTATRELRRSISALRPPLLVTLTRVAPRLITDTHDNLPGGFKCAADSVSKVLGIDDGDTARIRFVVQQEKRPKTYALRIRIEEVR